MDSIPEQPSPPEAPEESGITSERRQSESQTHEPPRPTGMRDADIRRLYSLSLSKLRKHSAFSEYHFKPAPFNLRWIYGFNGKPGVINLNDKGSTVCFYSAANCGVLYNWTKNTMRLLQGHKYMVRCIASDLYGRWIVTAGSGSENILVIWDSKDYFPQRTLFSPHGVCKLAKVAMSADAKYLITCAYTDKANIYWWIWSLGKDIPEVRLQLALTKDSIISIEFNPDNSKEFLLMTKTDIWVGYSRKIVIHDRGVTIDTDDYELMVNKPERNMYPDMGKNTCICFVAPTKQILVGTNRGAVLVYGYTIHYTKEGEHSDITQMRYIKSLKLEKNRINVIRSIDGVLVTGNHVGQIHFYDHQLKLLYWIHGFQVDCVRDIRFNISPRSYKVFDPKCQKACLCWEEVVLEPDPKTGEICQKLVKKKLPTESTVPGKPFVVRDFILVTNKQGILFVDFVTETYKPIVEHRTSNLLSMSTHPEKPLICYSNTDGAVKLINFAKHRVMTRIDLRDSFTVVVPPKDDSINCNYEITVPHLSATCLKYSPSGLQLACGLNTGQLIFLDPASGDILTKHPYKDTSFAIKEMDYSVDSLTLALADAGKTVCVYKYCCRALRWNFVAKHRAHFKDITALRFLPARNPSGDWKLISLGADRIMVEYDIGASSDEYLEILSLDRVDQSAVPLSGIPWPVPAEVDPETCRTDLPLILIANDEYKYKVVNYGTTMTLSTVLGPRYEHPVHKLDLFHRREENGSKVPYLFFATKNVIGLQQLPLDGNPWRHLAMMGHPNQLLVFCFREDIATLFTMGSKDSCISQWTVNFRSVDSTAKMGGIDLDPYYCLVENGRPGWLFQEIRDLFYYIQILCQGTFSPAMRRVKDYIPIESMPDLMRALGFFPSEYEVENLIVEAKYKIYLKDSVTEIDFEEFVKLYLNHRPAFGDNLKKIRNAYKTLATNRRDEYFITRDGFISLLHEFGEQFSKELSWYLLSILSGHSFEDRANMSPDDFSFLPDKIKFGDLISTIMGIRDYDLFDTQSLISASSQVTITSSIDSDE